MSDAIINLFSPCWEIQDSYGRKANELADGLNARGYHVNRWGDDCKCAIKPATGGIFLGYPTRYADFIRQFPLAGMGPKVAVTAWESTQIPDGWADALNQMGAVSVGSQFTADTLRQNNVGAPVHVHPLGISEGYRDTVLRPIQTPMTFICFADRNNRKGWIAAYKAFRMAFGDDPDYRLIVKSRRNALGLVGENVEVIAEDYSDAEMATLYHQSHVMIFPTMGEGFGLPPREFAASGGLSLVTDWSGTADGLMQWGVPLPYIMGPAWVNDPQRAGLGEWAYVHIQALADLLRHVANHYKSYQPFMMRAAGYVKAHYRWSRFTEQIHMLWQSLTKGETHAISVGN